MFGEVDEDPGKTAREEEERKQEELRRNFNHNNSWRHTFHIYFRFLFTTLIEWVEIVFGLGCIAGAGWFCVSNDYPSKLQNYIEQQRIAMQVRRN